MNRKAIDSILAFADRVGRVDSFAANHWETSKARLLVLCAPLFGLQALILVGHDIVAVHSPHWIVNVVALVAALSLLTTPFIIRYTRTNLWAGLNLCFWVVVALTISAFVEGGIYSDDVLIMVALPLLVGFVLSRKAALAGYVVLVCVFTVLVTLHHTGVIPVPQDFIYTNYFARYLFSLVALSSVFAITYAFSLLTEKSYNEFLEENRRLEMSLEVAGAAIWSLDLKTQKFFCTPNLHELFGRRIGEGEVGSDPFESMVHPLDQERIRQAWQNHFEGKSSRYDETFRIERGDGETRWLRSHFQIQVASTGRQSVLGFMTDVSEQLEAQFELERARDLAQDSTRLKSEFLANISHEIRTPLNGILGMTQALRVRDIGDDEREMVDTLTDSGKTLVAILNDVLDLSKIEAGKLSLTAVDADLRHALNRVYKLFVNNADEKQLSMELQVDDDLPASLRFDPVRVRQCVSNLVSNAVKFTNEGGVRIHVSGDHATDESVLVKIQVIDTGIGLDAQSIESLFQPFTQVDGSATRSVGGTGLGLSISRRLANLMGGDVVVESAPGEGSTFTLTFRAEQSANASLPTKLDDERVDDQGLAKSRVLLVDDNFVNRKVAKIFLEPYQMEVEEAQDGQEALNLLEARPAFDIVLLDVHMPVLDGTETIKRIRASGEPWNAIPVIALTADAMSGDKERYLEMGMTGYVSKPIDQSELLSEMARALSASLTPDRGTAEPEQKRA